jgi:signal transduction histidine kinase
MRPFFDQVGATLSNVSEIIERRRTQETLQVTNRRLEEALAELQAAQQEFARQERLRALGRMASGIAHDFNNALSPIMGYSEMLLAGTIDLGDRERVTNALRIVNMAARDAARIVTRLREFYRPREKGEVFLPVDLNQMIKQTISLTQPRWKTQAQGNGVAVQIKTRLQKTPPASGNEADLREMLANLIFNAVDAMPDGGRITIATRQETDRDEILSPSPLPETEKGETEKRGKNLSDSPALPVSGSGRRGWVVVEVSDTGTGMTEEVRQRCLEPFFTTKGEYGTGLGLAMVYGILRRHEGTIDIQSALGRGTTFVIRLPALTDQKTEKRGGKALPPARPLRVLAVDDEPRVLGVLKEYLTGDGHTVETASGGREGIEKFRAGSFDLVVTNRAMPGLSGDRLAGLVKQAAPDTPVILLTGFSEFMDATGERPRGVDLVLSKPLTLAALREAIARVSA